MSDNRSKASSLSKKVCLVTIGATASFATLIRAILSAAFFEALKAHQYTDLLVQYGADGEELYTTQLKQVQNNGLYEDITTSGFGLDSTGLGAHMRLAKTGGAKGTEGVVISHAGM